MQLPTRPGLSLGEEAHRALEYFSGYRRLYHNLPEKGGRRRCSGSGSRLPRTGGADSGSILFVAENPESQ